MTTERIMRAAQYRLAAAEWSHRRRRAATARTRALQRESPPIRLQDPFSLRASLDRVGL